MRVRRSRIPSSCPVGFQEQYTVVRGDTMFLIAQRLGIPLDELIKANPHIINPNLIYPGDVLCVPFQMTFPCCAILDPVAAEPPVPADARGVVLTRLVDGGQNHSLSILAVDLAPPAGYGDFDIYEGFFSIPDIGGFGFVLLPTTEASSEWGGSLTIGPFLTPTTNVQVRLANFGTGVSGPAVLQGLLTDCKIAL